MATARSAISPDVRAFEPSQETTTLDQIIAQNPTLAGLRYASGVDDANRNMQYLDALRQGQNAQLRLNAQDAQGKLLTDVITQDPNYVKAGNPAQIAALVHAITGISLPTTPDSLAAGALNRSDIASQTLEREGNTVKDFIGTGKSPINAQGGLNPDLTADGALTNYTDPETQAKITMANKLPAGAYPTITYNVGGTSVNQKLPMIPPSLQPPTLTDNTHVAPRSSSTSTGGTVNTPGQNTVETWAMQYAQPRGLKPIALQDKATGNQIIQFQDKTGKVVETHTFTKDGKLLK